MISSWYRELITGPPKPVFASFPFFSGDWGFQLGSNFLTIAIYSCIAWLGLEPPSAFHASHFCFPSKSKKLGLGVLQFPTLTCLYLAYRYKSCSLLATCTRPWRCATAFSKSSARLLEASISELWRDSTSPESFPPSSALQVWRRRGGLAHQTRAQVTPKLT